MISETEGKLNSITTNKATEEIIAEKEIIFKIKGIEGIPNQDSILELIDPDY